MGQASFRIPQAIGLAGNAGRKPHPGTAHRPAGIAARVQPWGCRGRSPLQKITLNPPSPAGEGGRGDGAKRLCEVRASRRGRAQALFRIPHPARQPDAAQAIPPCTPDSRHNRRGGLSRYTKHPCLSLRISFFSCLFKSYFLWYNKQSVVNTTRYVYAKSKGNTQDEAVFPKRWECRKQ